jgi:hypothetical protein
MFVSTRIVNGIIALVALLVGALFVMTAESSADLVLGGILGLVTLLFILDMNFRKKNTKSDVGFAVMWTLLFAYPTYQALKVGWASPIDFAFVATDIFLFVLPFLLNGIYLVRMYLPQGAPE